MIDWANFLSWFVPYWIVVTIINIATTPFFHSMPFWWNIGLGMAIGAIGFAITFTVLKPVSARIEAWLKA